VVTLALNKTIPDLVFTWKLGLKVPVLPLGRSGPPQTILLSDLVGFGSHLQIVLVVWCPFYKFEVCQTAMIVLRELSLPNPGSSNSKKVRQTAIICRNQLDRRSMAL
jgi:hypothetical protein